MGEKMAERKFFSGRTLEQALLAAARHYEIEPELVSYRTRDKKHGFLKIGRKVVIEVDPEQPQKTAEEVQQVEQRAKQPAEPTTRGFPERGDRTAEPMQAPPQEEESWWDDEEVVDDDMDAVERAVEQIAELAGLEISWTIEEQDDGILIDFEGEDADFIKEDGGKMLQTLEHLLPRIVRGWRGKGVACKVDCEGFRAAHEEALTERAMDIAEKVRSSQNELALEPMNPADRRIIHITLAEVPDVDTRSDGHGFMKRVRVIPVSA